MSTFNYLREDAGYKFCEYFVGIKERAMHSLFPGDSDLSWTQLVLPLLVSHS